jgi:hypothetical protein
MVQKLFSGGDPINLGERDHYQSALTSFDWQSRDSRLWFLRWTMYLAIICATCDVVCLALSAVFSL